MTEPTLFTRDEIADIAADKLRNARSTYPVATTVGVAHKCMFLYNELDQLAHFNPDWDMLQATRESLQEHMREVKGCTDAMKAALDLIFKFSSTEAGHHKQWLIDQVVRALTGDGYEAWVAMYEQGVTGPATKWDVGIAP